MVIAALSKYWSKKAKKDASIVFDIISHFIATKNHLFCMTNFCKCHYTSSPSYYVVQKQYKEVTSSEVGSYFREQFQQVLKIHISAYIHVFIERTAFESRLTLCYVVSSATVQKK